MALRNYLNALRRNPPTPPYLLFFVTARCDAKCKHCFFWRATDNPPEELTLAEIEKVAAHAGPLLQLTLTGGDAAQRDDLPEIAQLFAERCRCSNVTIGTNGYRTERVLSLVGRTLQLLPRGTNLTVDISIDGVGADHDAIRNTPGIFDAAVKTIAGLRDIKKQDRRLNICADTTVSHYNQDKLRPVYDFILNELKVDIINALYIRGEPREDRALDVDVARYEEFCAWIKEDTARGALPGYNFFTDTLHAKDIILRQIIIDTARTNRFQYPCTAARLTGVIYPQGDVAPCELLPVVFGNLREVDYDLGRIWNSAPVRDFRAKIRRERCFCVHQCFLSNNILFNPKLTPRLLAATAALKWARWTRPRREKGK